MSNGQAVTAIKTLERKATQMIFAESTNTQAYLKAGIMGFAGSGKTFTAKEIAIGLWKTMAERRLPGGTAPVFFLDTETGSDWVSPAFREAGIKLFVAKTRAFADLIPAVKEAEEKKSILIIDSITHFWRELTESYARKRNRQRGLEFQDWDWLKKEWGKFTDLFVNSNCHIIMCGRAGFEYDFFTDENNKKQLEKTGIKMKAETETGYEPSILILMEREQDMSGDSVTVTRSATVLKDRADRIDGQKFIDPTFLSFKPHIDFLNLGGEQFGVDTKRNSDGTIPRIDYSGADEHRERGIVLDEIRELLIKYHPSTSAADKKAKGDLLEAHTGTRSWERLSQSYDLGQLQIAHKALEAALRVAPTAAVPPPDELPYVHKEPVAVDEQPFGSDVPTGVSGARNGARFPDTNNVDPSTYPQSVKQEMLAPFESILNNVDLGASETDKIGEVKKYAEAGKAAARAQENVSHDCIALCCIEIDNLCGARIKALREAKAPKTQSEFV